jgi:hypothetical protein
MYSFVSMELIFDQLIYITSYELFLETEVGDYDVKTASVVWKYHLTEIRHIYLKWICSHLKMITNSNK